MRSYINKNGDKITVSEEHLETAIRIKQELQKASPSRKASWSQLTKLMEVEGFYDSDNNEAYRCMIKAHQKSIGELPEAPKYANMVTDGKLESIKGLVGEIAYEKRENQHVLRQLNKVKRDVIDYTLIAEQIGNAFKEHDFSDLKMEYIPIVRADRTMIVNLSDLHVGAIVNNEYNTYNFEIAKQRMQKYLDEVVGRCKRDDITNVYVMNLGDVIENPYMHNLSYTCEFTFAEQIVRASDLIIKFLVGLSEHVHVTTAGIAGNHDRFNAKKDENLEGDHAVKGVNYAIQSFIENTKNERIVYEQAKDYSHSLSVNGVNIKFVHGDLDGLNDANLIGRHSSIDNKNYSLIVMGHYHHFEARELGRDKMLFVCGTLKGTDYYGDKTRKHSAVSQGIIVIDSNGKVSMERINLD